MNFPLIVALVRSLFVFFVCLSQSVEARSSTTQVSAEEFIKIRCHPDGSPSFTQWSGNVTTSGPAAEKAQTLFKIVGFNVAKCYRDPSGNWMVSSRELTYFLNPFTGDILNTWNNPWTQETLPVVHISNLLVQQKIPGTTQFSAETQGATSVIRIDVPLSYPNPLAGDIRFADYSPENYYKAHESFSYVVANEDLKNITQLDSLKNVQVIWTRVSPWMPWMKMKGAAGYLVFNAIVSKVDGLSQLPMLIQSEIQNRLPLYSNAPLCIVAGRGNVSSWSYFKDNFASYLAGSRFPLAAPITQAQGECESL